MVNEEGEPVPLDSDSPSGRCPKCNRPFDDHRYRFNGQLGMEPVCPRDYEAIAGYGPPKEKK